MSSLTVEDRLEIQELNARFAFAVDRHDYGALREVFVPDAHYVSTNGTDLTGLEALIAWFESRVTPGAARVTRHGLSGLIITGVDAHSATGVSTWHTFATNEATPSRVPLFQVADFADRYVRVDGRWWIAERVTSPVFRDESLAPGAAPAADD